MPINLGTSGEWASGDPTSIPDGYVRSMRNMLLRPNRIAARPPFVYDNLMAIAGLMRWEDLANQQTRFLALDTLRNLYMKAATGETWGAAITGTLTASRVTDYANYRGKVYYMLDDGAGNPAAAAVFDSTTISAAPFNSVIVSRTITPFVDRLILGAPLLTTTNILSITASPTVTLPSYALDNATYWTPTNVTVTSTTESGETIVRLTPSSTGASACQITTTAAITASKILASPDDLTAVGTIFLRNNSAVDFPITLELYFASSALITYPGGSVPQNSLFATTVGGVVYIYEATTGGTVGAAPPAFGAGVGSITADNTVRWTNIGTDILGQHQDVCAANGQWQRYDVSMLVNKTHSTLKIGMRLKFYNDAQTALVTLGTVDATLRDGLTDGDARKANYGWQITAGDRFFPFFNAESTNITTSMLNSWIWSETTQPKVFRGANSFEPQEAAGLPTAACVLSGRFIGFKRRAFWVFKGTSDPDNPLLPESPATMADGCLGPRAVAVFADEAFFIGENEVYSFRVGGYPRPLAGDAMFETIMERGANWVENQPVYNMPLIAIDRAYGEVWVYTQKGKLFCYHMPESSSPSAASALFSGSPNKGSWTTHDVAGAEVAAMAFNPITQEMEFSFGGHGLARLDPSVTAKDTIDDTGTLYAVTKEIILKPFELYSPRYELCLHDIGIYHLATYTQAGEALYAYISFDRGATYPRFNEVRFDPTNPRIPISIFQAGLSVQLKLSHVGSAGEAAWCVSRGEATMELMSGEWPLSRPAQIASTLQ